MPPNFNNSVEETPPQEAFAPTSREFVNEAPFFHESIAPTETTQQDPSIFAVNTKTEIGDEARAVVDTGEHAAEEISLSLGSTPEEVRRVDAETGFMAKLRDIGNRVLDTALDASDKIDSVISKVDKGVSVIATAAVIGMGTVASTEVEPPSPPEAEIATPQMLEYWFGNNEVGDSLKTLLDFEASLRTTRDPNAPHTPFDRAKIQSAVALLEHKLTQYPPELRKDILSDETVPMVIENLDRIASMKGNASLSSDEMLSAGEVKEQAIHAAIKGVLTLKDDLINSAATKIKQGDKKAVDTVASLLSAHVDNVAEYADITDGSEDPAQHDQILRSIDEISLDVMLKLNPAYEQYRTPQKGRVLEYLAKAGYFEGVNILAEKIAKGKMSFADVPELFTDKAQVEKGILPNGDPILATINRGGEYVSNALLKQYGLLPEAYMKYWQQPKNSLVNVETYKERDEYMSTYNARIEQNTKNIVALEAGKKGSVEALTRDYGIRFPGRYPVQLLREQLDGKDVVRQNFGMAITTRQDYNGGFDSQSQMANLYLEAKKIGSTLRVAEAEDAQEVMQRSLAIIDRNHGEKADFIQLGGHGSPSMIAMGQGQKGVIDASIFGVGPSLTSLVLKDGAPVLLDACSTGTPEGVAQELSKNVSGPITAPDNPSYIKSLQLSRDITSGQVNFAVKFGTTELKPVHTMTYASGRELGAHPLTTVPSQKGANIGNK